MRVFSVHHGGSTSELDNQILQGGIVITVASDFFKKYIVLNEINKILPMHLANFTGKQTKESWEHSFHLSLSLVTPL